MWHFLLDWGRSWRRRDVLVAVFASLLMVVGMAALVHKGAWVLFPLLLGLALLWRTPLSRNPFDLGPVDPKPHVPPWKRDARRRERERARRKTR